MLIITGCNAKLRHLLPQWKKAIEQQGYEYEVYDLGNLGEGTPFEISDKSFLHHGYYQDSDLSFPWRGRQKPGMILDAMMRHTATLISYMDVDAIMLQHVDKIREKKFDIALTLRCVGSRTLREHLHFAGVINAGVMFFRQNVRTLEFLKRWEKDAAKSSDQPVINSYLRQASYLRRHWRFARNGSAYFAPRRLLNSTQTVHGCKVLLVSPMYNYTMPYLKRGVRVAHAAGNRRGPIFVCKRTQ